MIIPAGQVSSLTVGFCEVEAILANKTPNAIPVFAFSGARCQDQIEILKISGDRLSRNLELLTSE